MLSKRHLRCLNDRLVEVSRGNISWMILGVRCYNWTVVPHDTRNGVSFFAHWQVSMSKIAYLAYYVLIKIKRHFVAFCRIEALWPSNKMYKTWSRPHKVTVLWSRCWMRSTKFRRPNCQRRPMKLLLITANIIDTRRLPYVRYLFRVFIETL